MNPDVASGRHQISWSGVFKGTKVISFAHFLTLFAGAGLFGVMNELCPGCFGFKRITIPLGKTTGFVTLDCPVCGGDGNLFA